MKKLFIIIAFLLLAIPAHAGKHGQKKIIINNNTTYVSNYANEEKNEFGAKLDAPYLVEVYKNWYIGVEGSKDAYKTNMNEGWEGYLKATYTGTVFSFRKDK